MEEVNEEKEKNLGLPSEVEKKEEVEEVFSLDTSSTANKSAGPSDNPSGKKKSSLKAVGLIVILALLLVGAGWFVYDRFFTNTRPMDVFKVAVDKMYTSFTRVYGPNTKNPVNMLLEDKGTSLDAGINLKLKMAGEEKAYNFSTLVEVESNYENMVFELGLKQNEKNILDLGFYQKEKNMYLQSKSLYPKAFDLGKNEYMDEEMIEELKQDDIYGLVTATKEYVVSNMKEEDFSVSSVSLAINKTEKQVNKYTYTLSPALMETLFKNYADYIENEVKSGTFTLGEDTLNAIKTLKNADYSQLETTYINLYTFKNKEFVGFDIENSKELLHYYLCDGKLDAVLNDDDYAYKFLGTTIQDKMNIDFYAVENSKEERIGSFVVEEYEVKQTSEKIRLSYKIEVQGELLEGELMVEVQRGADAASAGYNIGFKVEYKENEIALNTNLKVKAIDKIEFPDFKNAKDLDELTEEDIETILDNLQEATKDTDFEGITDMIDSFARPNYGDNDNWDYDDDWQFDDDWDLE